MKQYIGTSTVLATAMTLGAYNLHRGWNIPKDENPEAEGYLVQSPQHDTETWTLKNQFEQTFVTDGSYSFGHAMWLLERGARVCRAGWNGKNMFLFKVGESKDLIVNREPLLSILGEGATFNYQSHINMFTADGTIVPWLCSQSDMQAHDWCIVEPDAQD